MESGSRFRVQGAGFARKVQGSRCRVRAKGSGFKVRVRAKVQGSRCGFGHTLHLADDPADGALAGGLAAESTTVPVKLESSLG
jgi:hypothetical protein